MTAAEQIYHNASLKNVSATSADSNAYGSGSARLNVADVSSQFNLEYYNTMSRQPDHLHGFYGKQSQMVHSVEGDLEAPICTTLEVSQTPLSNFVSIIILLVNSCPNYGHGLSGSSYYC